MRDFLLSSVMFDIIGVTTVKIPHKTLENCMENTVAS